MWMTDEPVLQSQNVVERQRSDQIQTKVHFNPTSCDAIDLGHQTPSKFHDDGDDSHDEEDDDEEDDEDDDGDDDEDE